MLVIGSFSHVPFTWADKGKWITPLFPCDTDHILLRSILYCVVLPYCAHCIYHVCFDYSFFFFTIYIHVLLPIKKKKIHLVDVNDHKRSSADLPQASFFHIHGYLLAFLWILDNFDNDHCSCYWHFFGEELGKLKNQRCYAIDYVDDHSILY